jgi:regulatory protein
MNCQTYFLTLLARREYSAYELRKKGENKGFDYNEITDTLEYFQQQGYQSDASVAENMILYGKGEYGKPVLKRNCLAKGIAEEVFEQTWLESAEEMESHPLSELKSKAMRKYKLDDFHNLDHKTKAKLLNFLKYRGFNPFAVLRQWQEES